MSALHTIIETYIRFADEQALLALQAHRLKLLATIDETNPFFGNLRSQCLEEISSIEAGLVRLRPPEPVATPALAATADSEPSETGSKIAPSWTASAPTAGESFSVLASAPEPDFVSSVEADLLNPEASSKLNGKDRAAHLGTPASTIDLSLDTDRLHSSETIEVSSALTTSAAEEADVPCVPATASSFIAYWLLRMQEGPSELDQGLLPVGLNGSVDGSAPGAVIGRLLAGLHRLADVYFCQGGSA